MIDTHGDLQVLQQLSKYGSDLTKPHEIDHYLYFVSKQSAIQAANKLKAHGFSAYVNTVPYPWWKRLFRKWKWGCYAKITMIPAQEEVFRITALLTQIAQQHGGEYDGWETAIIK